MLFLVSQFETLIRLQIVHWRVELVYYFLTNCQEKNGLIDRCEERAMVSSLPMNRIAGMPEILEPTGRPFFAVGSLTIKGVHLV